MLEMKKKKNSTVMDTAIGTKCNACDVNFKSEIDFKEHILTTVHRGPSDGTRNFQYRLTAKTAKSNLIKGALRKHIEIEHKQGAINIDFSDGSWILAAFPEVLNWDKGNRMFSYGDINIQVTEAKPGIERGNKHVDYKIVFLVNNQKVVLHAYNSKQRFTVSGQNHVNFVTKYLEPFFTKKIEFHVSDADKFNESVLENLGRTVKREKVKFKTSTSVSCKRCNQISNSISQLHAHMREYHDSIMSPNISTDLGRYHSTKNNTMADSLMAEDISIEALLNDSTEKNDVLMLDCPTLEEFQEEDKNQTKRREEKYKCDVWYKDNSPCYYKSTSPTDVLEHMKLVHSDSKEEVKKEEMKEEKKEGSKEERKECLYMLNALQPDRPSFPGSNLKVEGSTIDIFSQEVILQNIEYLACTSHRKLFLSQVCFQGMFLVYVVCMRNAHLLDIIWSQFPGPTLVTRALHHKISSGTRQPISVAE